MSCLATAASMQMRMPRCSCRAKRTVSGLEARPSLVGAWGQVSENHLARQIVEAVCSAVRRAQSARRHMLHRFAHAVDEGDTRPLPQPLSRAC